MKRQEALASAACGQNGQHAIIAQKALIPLFLFLRNMVVVCHSVRFRRVSVASTHMELVLGHVVVGWYCDCISYLLDFNPARIFAFWRSGTLLALS